MNGLVEFVKSISFHLKWIFMSPRERYAHLWATTRKLAEYSGLRESNLWWTTL